MTSFGPVPYDSIKEHLPKEVTEILNKNREKLCAPDEDAPTNDENIFAEATSCIQNLAKKLGWKLQKMENYLKTLWSINPSVAFSLVLKEIAVELDQQYEGHINTCEELFIISTMDGRIHKVPRAYIKNFRNFAAFRTEEDAKIACRVLREPLKEMFKSGRE